MNYTAKDIKRYAYQDMELPKGDPFEDCFWIAMNYIYKGHANRVFNAEEAKRLSTKAQHDFAITEMWHRIYLSYLEMERLCEVALMEWYKNPTDENAQKVCNILKGERKLKNEYKEESETQT